MAGIDLNGHYDESADPNSFEPIPAGVYQAQIVEAKKQDISKSNNYGECLVLAWQVIGGDYNDRLVFQRLNLWGENMNNNDQVVRIANSQFAQIREATGQRTPRDTDELLYIPCLIKVAVTQDRNKEYDPRNEIKAVKPLEGGGASAGIPKAPKRPGVLAQQSIPPVNAAAASGASRPWGKSAPAAAALEDDDVPF